MMFADITNQEEFWQVVNKERADGDKPSLPVDIFIIFLFHNPTKLITFAVW